MAMEIKEVTNQQDWTNFVRSYTPNTLLQSWNWLEFSQKRGEKTLPLGLYEGDRLVGAALFVKVESKRANYLVCHGGPLVDWSQWENSGQSDQFDLFHQHLIDLSRQEKVDFFRIRPPLMHNQRNLRSFLKAPYRYKLAPMYFQAEHTLHLDLTKSEDDLLAGMRKNTRYYIRKAGKNGVEVRVSQDRADLDRLYDLYLETVERQQFVPYKKQYLVDEFEAFVRQQSADVDLVLGYYQGQLLSAAMIIYYDQTAYYHHGASIRHEPDVFASYLVQWEAIKRAKQRGMTLYDFWGVAPTDDPKHSRAGLTLFKRGFGGERIRWLHTLDYPMTWRYWPMYAYVKFERWKRRL